MRILLKTYFVYFNYSISEWNTLYTVDQLNSIWCFQVFVSVNYNFLKFIFEFMKTQHSRMEYSIGPIRNRWLVLSTSNTWLLKVYLQKVLFIGQTGLSWMDIHGYLEKLLFSRKKSNLIIIAMTESCLWKSCVAKLQYPKEASDIVYVFFSHDKIWIPYYTVQQQFWSL